MSPALKTEPGTVYSVNFSWINDHRLQDHGSYSLNTEHMPARLTCISSLNPHNLMKWHYCHSHLIKKHRQWLVQGPKPSKAESQQWISKHLTWALLLITVPLTWLELHFRRSSLLAYSSVPSKSPSYHLQAISHSNARVTLSNTKSDHLTLLEISSMNFHW